MAGPRKTGQSGGTPPRVPEEGVEELRADKGRKDPARAAVKAAQASGTEVSAVDAAAAAVGLERLVQTKEGGIGRSASGIFDTPGVEAVRSEELARLDGRFDPHATMDPVDRADGYAYFTVHGDRPATRRLINQHGVPGVELTVTRIADGSYRIILDSTAVVRDIAVIRNRCNPKTGEVSGAIGQDIGIDGLAFTVTDGENMTRDFEVIINPSTQAYAMVTLRNEREFELSIIVSQDGQEVGIRREDIVNYFD
ncbi:MAG: hypothetical protein HYU97_10480 [Deltaproteobacteria bacterium]|nr:hypothetical protein [Deltaproteobacteria bacterium]